MTVSSASPELRTVCGVVALARVELGLEQQSVMPMTPFIGVRISWLMFARNSDFSRDASVALSRALGHGRLGAGLRGDVGERADPAGVAAVAVGDRLRGDAARPGSPTRTWTSNRGELGRDGDASATRQSRRGSAPTIEVPAPAGGLPAGIPVISLQRGFVYT